MDNFISILTKSAISINARYFIIAGTAFVLFYVLLRKFIEHKKIQQRYPKLKDYFREVSYSLISMSIFACVAATVLVILKPYTLLFDEVFAYGKVYYGLSFLLMVILHDTYFYWMHRMMHHPFLYKHIHLVHHKSTNPSPWTAYAFHPLEAVLEAGIFVLIAFLIPAHISTIILFFLFQIIYNVYGHLGWELYGNKLNNHFLGKWINTSVSHNQHHQFFHGNYGLYFTFWDRMMGTLREDYEQQFNENTKRKLNN